MSLIKAQIRSWPTMQGQAFIVLSTTTGLNNSHSNINVKATPTIMPQIPSVEGVAVEEVIHKHEDVDVESSMAEVIGTATTRSSVNSVENLDT